MDATLDAAPGGFLSVADDGSILCANATLGEWLGRGPTDLVGQPVEVILSPVSRRFYQTHVFPLLRLRGQVEEIYLALAGPGGRALTVLTSAVRRTRADAFVTDHLFLSMGQRRRYEEELLQAKKAAEKAIEAKSAFLSMMSHELRTPLNAILGFGQLLEAADLAPRDAESVRHVVDAGRNLLCLVDEMLDLAGIDPGRLHLALEPVRTGPIMREVLDLAQALAGQRGIGLRLLPGAAAEEEEGEGEEAAVRADPGRLRQILLNLVTTSLRLNRAGGTVTLGCEAGDPDGGGRQRFMVRDSGGGIAAHRLGRFFVPFGRRSDGGGVVGEGMALRLTWCQRLAEAMGGRIGVGDGEAGGGCLWVELPREPGAGPREPPGSPPAAGTGGVGGAPPGTGTLRPARTCLLYVEDNPLNVRLVETIVAGRPALHLFSAATGQDGLALARARRPDLILLDLQLPDMTGDAVLAALGEDAGTRDIPVVVLSADAAPDRIERLRQAGARDYLTKPFELAQFWRVLDERLPPRLTT